MADSFGKKEREKKKRQRKKEKELKKQERKESGKTGEEFMYVDHNGNFTSKPPEERVVEEVSLDDIQISTPKKEESDVGEFTRTGVVKFFDTDKGYGFIIDPATQESFFVHYDSITEDITQNDKVTFEVGKGEKGPVALDVRLS
ncbi:MAG: cold shock domain-containing protein [Bacteroidia bacterium]